VKLSFFSSFLGLALLVSGCANDTRFPICKSDAECAAREENQGKLLCDNLRCVQCRYDDDCPAGSYCDKTLICQSVSPKQTEDPQVSTAQYKTLDECLKGCQDPTCPDICSARFAEPSKKPIKTKKRR
jgi:Cys-rich repeat protein